MKFNPLRPALWLLWLLIFVVVPAAAQAPAELNTDAGSGAKKVTARAKNGVSLPLEKSQPVKIARFASAPEIDGKLNDEVWKTAPVLKDFYQYRPGDNIAPSHPTETRIGYDEKNIYFAFRAWDEPGKVRATVAKRDNVFDDDNVRILLDTFNDQRKAYILMFNPLGIQADGIFTEGAFNNNEDYSVDIVMESKGQLLDDGYSVEVAIPFKSLRYETGKGKQWGIHVSRAIKHINDERDSWMPISRDQSGLLNQAGHITGIENISTERTLEIIPSLTVAESGRRVSALPAGISSLNNAGRLVNQPVNLDPGLNIKYSLTPNITLDFTANPDFAQVEADQTLITANQRFPLFYAEKRPFFLEGSEIFQTDLQAVHTRSIVDPDFAAKLTGKRGRNSFGLMTAVDRAPGNYSEDERNDPATFKDIAKFLDHKAYIGVLRLKHDVGSQSNIGLLATTYNFIEKHNHLGGVDGRFRLNPQATISFQVLGTNSRRYFYDPDLDKNVFRTGNGFGYLVNFDLTKRNFGLFALSEGRTRDYRADVGFTRRTNSNFSGLFTRFSSEPKPKATLILWRVFNREIVNYDWQGRLQNLSVGGNAFLQFKHQLSWGFGTNHGYERIFEEEFGRRRTLTRTGAFAGNNPERSTQNQRFFSFIEAKLNKKYSVQAEVGYAINELDYDFGGGRKFPRISPAALVNPAAQLDPGPGNSINLATSFIYQPADALRISLDYTKSRLTRNDTRRLAYDDNIYSLKATYQFTRFLFFRARADYTTLGSTVRSQLLFGLTPSPGTSFYAGYNDDLNYNNYSPFSDRYEPGLHRNGRTFFIKMSYLIRRSFK